MKPPPADGGLDHKDDWLDQLRLTKSDMRDGANLARIGSALDALENAEQDLTDAVAAARAAGDSWAAIRTVPGTSRQAVDRKFGKPTAKRGTRRTGTIVVAQDAAPKSRTHKTL